MKNAILHYLEKNRTLKSENIPKIPKPWDPVPNLVLAGGRGSVMLTDPWTKGFGRGAGYQGSSLRFDERAKTARP